MPDYNQTYYNVAVSALKEMKYYYGDLIQECSDYVKRFYPKANDKEVKYAVQWALADTWHGGCETEES